MMSVNYNTALIIENESVRPPQSCLDPYNIEENELQP